MATIEVTLEKGITVGDKTHTRAVLREHNAGDVMDATADSERPVLIGETPHLVASPQSMAVHVLRRQIVSLGDIKGPLEVVQLRLLSAEDLNRLNDGAQRLELAAALATQAAAGGQLGDLSPAEHNVMKIAAVEAINAAIAASRSVTQRGRSDDQGAALPPD